MSRILSVVLDDPDAARDVVPFGTSTPRQMDPWGEGLVCGSNLPRHLAALARLARKLSLEPLESFQGPDLDALEIGLEMAEEAGDEQRAAELRRRMKSPRFFASEDGLRTVEALISTLLGHPEELGDRDEVWWVVWDLRALELTLRAAARAVARFTLVEG